MDQIYGETVLTERMATISGRHSDLIFICPAVFNICCYTSHSTIVVMLFVYFVVYGAYAKTSWVDVGRDGDSGGNEHIHVFDGHRKAADPRTVGDGPRKVQSART